MLVKNYTKNSSSYKKKQCVARDKQSSSSARNNTKNKKRTPINTRFQSRIVAKYHAKIASQRPQRTLKIKIKLRYWLILLTLTFCGLTYGHRLVASYQFIRNKLQKSVLATQQFIYEPQITQHPLKIKFYPLISPETNDAKH